MYADGTDLTDGEADAVAERRPVSLRWWGGMDGGEIDLRQAMVSL